MEITKSEETLISEEVEKMKQFYPYFNENHLKRNLKFYPKSIPVLFGFTTYPRTGSNLLINMFENINGYFVGSDFSAEISKTSVATGNIRGSVNYCHQFKSHFPHISFYPCRINENIKLNRTIVSIRNPFPTFLSYYNYYKTRNYTKKMNLSEFDLEEWDKTITYFSKGFRSFFDYWIKQAKNGHNIYFIRYEETSLDPIEALVKIFMMNDLVLSDERKIEISNYVNKNGVNSNHHKGVVKTTEYDEFYNEDQIKRVIKETEEVLCYFGYKDEIMKKFNIEIKTSKYKNESYLDQNELMTKRIIDKTIDLEKVITTCILDNDDEYEVSSDKKALPEFVKNGEK